LEHAVAGAIALEGRGRVVGRPTVELDDHTPIAP
jgi:hypothetical protein